MAATTGGSKQTQSSDRGCTTRQGLDPCDALMMRAEGVRRLNLAADACGGD